MYLFNNSLCLWKVEDLHCINIENQWTRFLRNVLKVRNEGWDEKPIPLVNDLHHKTTFLRRRILSGDNIIVSRHGILHERARLAWGRLDLEGYIEVIKLNVWKPVDCRFWLAEEIYSIPCLIVSWSLSKDNNTDIGGILLFWIQTEHILCNKLREEPGVQKSKIVEYPGCFCLTWTRGGQGRKKVNHSCELSL